MIADASLQNLEAEHLCHFLTCNRCVKALSALMQLFHCVCGVAREFKSTTRNATKKVAAFGDRSRVAVNPSEMAARDRLWPDQGVLYRDLFFAHDRES
jgi:hypothetical protein